MKKLLAAVVAIVMVLGLTCTAFAAGSPELPAEIVKAVDKDGKDVALTFTENCEILKTNPLTIPKAAELIGGGVPEKELAKIWEACFTAATTPVTLTFNAPGTTSTQTLYVFHYVNDAWKLEGSGPCPQVTVTVDSASPWALVVRTPGSDGKSPNTGESNAIPAAVAVIIAAGALAFVLNSKKKTA